MIKKHILIEQLTVFMKEHGYNKHGQNWQKICGDITIAITIQNSQYDRDTYYMCFGISINELAKSKHPSAHMCHIRARLDGDALTGYEQIVFAIDLWEKKFGDIKKLRKAAIENKLPIQSDRIAISYLTTIQDFDLLFK